MSDSKIVGNMQVVDNMNLQPGHCGICRCTPTDHEGNVEPCIDTGVDINWGEQLYICGNCANIIGILAGNEDKDVAAKLRADLDQAETARQQAVEECEMLQARIDRMIDGRRAVKEAKSKKKVKSEQQSQ